MQVRNIVRKFGPKLAAVGTSALVLGAQAATDTTAIDNAKTDMLAYCTALLGLGIAVWAALKVVKMFGGK